MPSPGRQDCQGRLSSSCRVKDFVTHDWDKRQERIFIKLFEAAEIAAFSPEERKQYEHDMMTENDYRNTIEFAKNKAREEGLRRGLDEGIEKGLVTAARNLKKMGMETNAIIQATGLSETVIRNL